MSPLSRLIEIVLAALRPAPAAPSGAWNDPDTRASRRYDADIPVLIGPRGGPGDGPGDMPAATGVVVNLSLLGAAIRIIQDETNQSAWMTGLDQGDELLLTGLLEGPVSCWLVVIDDEVLRVHFSSDPAPRQLLLTLIETLEPP